ncbi:MAG TPA: glycosyltransferase family 39 protein [Solirubrobacterales bacterium]|nr:glycosyltransferase family 39 protein [Solirubrobacterales bacterium]
MRKARHLNGALAFLTDAKRLIALGAVTLVAIVVRAPLLGSAFTSSDTDQYLAIAKGIFHGGYTDNVRAPGYATLLAIFELVAIDPVHGVVFLQNLVGIALPAFVVLVGWRYFSPLVGVVAGFLTAASPLAIAVEQFALSDYLFGVAFFVAAVLLAESVIRVRAGKDGWEVLAAAGVMFGVATLVRANGLIGFVAIPLALLVGARAWRPALRCAAIAVAAMAIVLAPWCIHNLIRFGDPNVSNEGGLALYARAVSWAEMPPSPDTADGRLALRVYNTADPNVPHAAAGTTSGVYNAFVGEGKTPREAYAAMGAIARETVLDDPGAYADDTVEALGLYREILDPHTFTSDPNFDQVFKTRGYIRGLNPGTEEIPGDSRLTRIPWQIAQSLNKLLFVFTIGGLLMLILPFVGRERSRLAASTLLIVGGVGIVGVALTARWEQRYIISLLPFIWLLGTATVAQLVSLLAAALRQLPRPRAQGEAA